MSPEPGPFDPFTERVRVALAGLTDDETLAAFTLYCRRHGASWSAIHEDTEARLSGDHERLDLARFTPEAQARIRAAAERLQALAPDGPESDSTEEGTA